MQHFKFAAAMFSIFYIKNELHSKIFWQNLLKYTANCII